MPDWTTVAAWSAALVAAAWGIDRVLVACELRGWILYRLTPRPRHEMRRAAGSMLVGVDGLFRPGARHIATGTTFGTSPTAESTRSPDRTCPLLSARRYAPSAWSSFTAPAPKCHRTPTASSRRCINVAASLGRSLGNG